MKRFEQPAEQLIPLGDRVPEGQLLRLELEPLDSWKGAKYEPGLGKERAFGFDPEALGLRLDEGSTWISLDEGTSFFIKLLGNSLRELFKWTPGANQLLQEIILNDKDCKH